MFNNLINDLGNNKLSMDCPYCHHRYVLSNETVEDSIIKFNIEDYKHKGKIGKIFHCVCPNPQCQQPVISVELSYADYDPITQRYTDIEHLLSSQLIPKNMAKIFPNYIPKQLRNDYEEAYSILELSPKASATLSRRCLQGIIRDFYGICKKRLIDEINELQGKIENELWDAIDSVRSLGNIGAHMESDVNVIIDIDEDEAYQLIALIELLFEEWYIRREERSKKLKLIKTIADTKKLNKKAIEGDKN